jgi:hypothetical protein
MGPRHEQGHQRSNERPPRLAAKQGFADTVKGSSYRKESCFASLAVWTQRLHHLARSEVFESIRIMLLGSNLAVAQKLRITAASC